MIGMEIGSAAIIEGIWEINNALRSCFISLIKLIKTNGNMNTELAHMRCK